MNQRFLVTSTSSTRSGWLTPDPFRAETQRDDVAVFALAVDQEPEPVGGELREVPLQPVPLGAGDRRLLKPVEGGSHAWLCYNESRNGG